MEAGRGSARSDSSSWGDVRFHAEAGTWLVRSGNGGPYPITLGARENVRVTLGPAGLTPR